MKLLLYFADGFAWQYCQEAGFMTDFWKIYRPLETLLGYSSTIFPSMLSGKYPQETGIWTEYYYSPRPQTRLERICTSSPLILVPMNLARLVLFRFARKAGSPTAHRLRIPLEFAHLFQHNPLDYRKFPPIELEVPTLDDVFRDKGLRFDIRFLEGSPDVRNELHYLQLRRQETDVFFYFDHALDAKGHHVGASSAKLKPEMDQIEQFLAQAWNVLGGAGECEMLLFSDHGMTDVRETFDLLHALKGFTLGKDYLVFIDSSFARFWFPDPQKREPIMASLASAPGRFLTVEDLQWNGLDFEDDRYGQEVLISNEGVVFHPNYISPSFFRTQNYLERGMHGYWPKYSSSYGLFAYRGSRLQVRLPDPVPAVDIFTAVMGILNGAETITRGVDAADAVKPRIHK